MSQSLAKDFNFRSLLKFAFPSIIMMIFMSLSAPVKAFPLHHIPAQKVFPRQ